jgi:hypothetical protein
MEPGSRGRLQGQGSEALNRARQQRQETGKGSRGRKQSQGAEAGNRARKQRQ